MHALKGLIYCKGQTYRVGVVRSSLNGRVIVYLSAEYWPDDKRGTRVGDQYMGEFESFENFKNSGSFEDLEYYRI